MAMALKKPQQSFQYSDEEYFQKADNLIHSSCPVLRSLFRRRWKHATGSEWSEASAREFISGLGKDAYYKVRPIQKKLMELGKLEEWDISLLGFLLKQINWRSDRDKWKDENKAVEQLVQLRNNAAHMPTKKLTEKAYKKIEESVRAQLAVFGVTSEEIEVMIENAGVLTPVSGWSAAMQIVEKGEEQFRKKKYREAIKLYGDALQIPNLLQENQAILLEKRAEAHLALAESMTTRDSERNVVIEESLQDVKQALECKTDSWKAHQIIGKVYRLQNNFKLAMEHLNMSLAISPGQTEVKTELDCCKLLLGQMSRSEHLDPTAQPMTFEERIKHFTNETGKPMTKKMWREMEACLDELIPGQSHVQTGHRYAAGWEVKQDYQEASRYYAKADKLGNAEGTFNLAKLYMYGNGVEQHIPYAIELLRKAANMPPEIKHGGKWGQKIPNIGVPCAQQSLGLKYEDGIHVSQDYAEAAKWYEKAASNGDGKAANNLARLYSLGLGVQHDSEKAVAYWKLAVLKKDMNAACSLYLHYLREKEPGLARIHFERSIEFGNDHLSRLQPQVMDELRKLEKEREKEEAEVVAFEKKNGLDCNGLTFHQRYVRKVRHGEDEGEVVKAFVESREALEDIFTSKKSAGKVHLNQMNPEELLQKAAEGSTTARKLIRALKGAYEFERLWGKGPPFTEDQSKKLIDVFHDCFRTEHHVIALSEGILSQVLSYFENQLRIHGHAKSELDRKLRTCYCFGKIYRVEAIGVLKVGLERYPDDDFFYHMLSMMYGGENNYKLGLQVADKGLSRFPDHVGLLYNKAVHTRLLRGKQTSKIDVRNAYKRFIEKAEKDHRKLPEAYYAMAVSFMEDFDNGKIVQYFNLGQEAEKVQLSCYLPYNSSSKAMVEGIVKVVSKKKAGAANKGKGQSKTPAVLPPKPPRNSRPYLQDPWRLIRIKEHRSSVRDVRKRASMQMNPGDLSIPATQEPSLQHKLSHLTNLKSIKMNEIDASKDHIYEGRILNLTIIEDAIVGVFTAVSTLAEDENGDVVRIHVYNVPHNAATAEQLGFGSRLSVINPYLRMGSMDLLPFIRVDDPRCIIYNDGVNDMCRYCGEENAAYNCAKCKRAKYCSRDCQEKDWKILKHKLICA